MATAASTPLKISLVAAADLSSSQYKFVKLDSNGKAVVCSGLTDVPVGVLQNKPVTNAEAEIVVLGVTKLQADALLTAGNPIGTSADGQADPRVIGTDTTHYVSGQALTGASAAGVIFTALINCADPHRAA